MDNGPRKFNPELLQALWLIGGIEPEELVSQAIIALQEGFSGSALQQLAGLTSPTRRDLGRLPERAFAEMGMREMDRSQAARYAVENYNPSSSPLVAELVKSFPAFAVRWEKHLADWRGEPAGAYIDMSEFVEFVVKDLYEKGLPSEVQRAFERMEESLSQGDQDTKDLVSLGFFETLQCVASHRPYGNHAFEPFLGPISRQVWEELHVVWSGKSSLMDVIRAERLRNEEE